MEEEEQGDGIRKVFKNEVAFELKLKGWEHKEKMGTIF